MNKRNFSASENKQIRKLVVDSCCNYVGGNCVMLDDGDEHTCPMIISNHLCCDWFFKAVLPMDVEMYVRFIEDADDHIGECEICGKIYKKRSNSAKYCKRCAANRTRIKKAIYMSKKRAINVEK